MIGKNAPVYSLNSHLREWGFVYIFSKMGKHYQRDKLIGRMIKKNRRRLGYSRRTTAAMGKRMNDKLKAEGMEPGKFSTSRGGKLNKKTTALQKADSLRPNLAGVIGPLRDEGLKDYPAMMAI